MPLVFFLLNIELMDYLYVMREGYLVSLFFLEVILIHIVHTYMTYIYIQNKYISFIGSLFISFI